MTDMRISFDLEAFKKANFISSCNPEVDVALYCADVEEDAGMAYEYNGTIYCFFSGRNLDLEEALEFFKSSLTPQPRIMPSEFAKMLRMRHELVAQWAAKPYYDNKQPRLLADCATTSHNHNRLWVFANLYEHRFIVKTTKKDKLAAANWVRVYCWVHGVRLSEDAAQALVIAEGINWKEVDRLVAEQQA